MASRILSATYGDETSNRDITDSVVGRVSNKKLALDVNSGLIPIVTQSAKTSLTGVEQAAIKLEAEKQCGNANDTGCMENTIQRLGQAKLEDKRLATNDPSNLVKGRRLTIKYVDAQGKEQTSIVPEGQKLELDNVAGKPSKPMEFKLPSSASVGWEVLKNGTIIATTFFYVFSIVATWKVFRQAGYVYVAYAATAASVFIPYSGYFIMLVFFAVMAYQQGKISLPTTQ